MEEVLFVGMIVVFNRDEFVGILLEILIKLLYVVVVGEFFVIIGVKEKIVDVSLVKFINVDIFLVDKLFGVIVIKIGVDFVVVSVFEIDVGIVVLLLILNLELRRGDDFLLKIFKFEVKILFVGWIVVGICKFVLDKIVIDFVVVFRFWGVRVEVIIDDLFLKWMVFWLIIVDEVIKFVVFMLFFIIEVEVLNKLFEFCNKMVDESKICLLDGDVVIDGEVVGKDVLELGIKVEDFLVGVEKNVKSFCVVMEWIDKFEGVVIMFDEFLSVFGIVVEFLLKSEFVVKIDEFDVFEFVNFEWNEESVVKFVNEGMDNEGEFEIIIVLLLIVLFDMLILVVVVENVLFLVGLREGDNDLLILDVEFIRIVDGKCEIKIINK